MLDNRAVLSPLIRKLESRNILDDEDRAAIEALPFTLRTYQPAAYLVREGQAPLNRCSLVLSGYAFRQKLTVEGSRQIVSLHMAGDMLDLQHLFLNRADHNVQALTVLETADVDRSALQALSTDRPAVGRAMWIDALIDASIFREWVVNVGQRDAKTRVAHLLCEFAARSDAAGIGEKGVYELPMTQEQLGDATGLTSVHVNRTLKALAAVGLIKRTKRHLSFESWEGISRAAGFSSLYLHLDQALQPAT